MLFFYGDATMLLEALSICLFGNVDRCPSHLQRFLNKTKFEKD